MSWVEDVQEWLVDKNEEVGGRGIFQGIFL